MIGERTPRTTLTLVIRRKNGEVVEVLVTRCRLDTAEEISRTTPVAFCSGLPRTFEGNAVG